MIDRERDPVLTGEARPLRVRSEPLLAWIRSVLTTMDGEPMSIGTDTATEIVRRIDSRANNKVEFSERSEASER